jgi:hypothetical protein
MRWISAAEHQAAEARRLGEQAERLQQEIEQLSARMRRNTGELQAQRHVPLAPWSDTPGPPTEALQRAVVTTAQEIARLRQQYIALLDQAHEHLQRAEALRRQDTAPQTAPQTAPRARRLTPPARP